MHSKGIEMGLKCYMLRSHNWEMIGLQTRNHLDFIQWVRVWQCRDCASRWIQPIEMKFEPMDYDRLKNYFEFTASGSLKEPVDYVPYSQRVENS